MFLHYLVELFTIAADFSGILHVRPQRLKIHLAKYETALIA